MAEDRRYQDLRYESDPSELYSETVQQIERLAEEEGNDTARRAFAKAMAPRLQKEWIGANNVKPTSGKECVHRLLGESRCPEEGGKIECFPPGSDHDSLWIAEIKPGKKREPYAFVTQPYGLSFQTLQSLVQFCNRYGLKADINALSWYFPTGTLRVVLKKKSLY